MKVTFTINRAHNSQLPTEAEIKDALMNAVYGTSRNPHYHDAAFKRQSLRLLLAACKIEVENDDWQDYDESDIDKLQEETDRPRISCEEAFRQAQGDRAKAKKLVMEHKSITELCSE